MPRKSYKPEEIVAKLRQVDVLTSQGQSVAEAIRSIGVRCSRLRTLFTRGYEAVSERKLIGIKF